MESKLPLGLLKRLAKGLAAQFGEDCEIVIHDLTGDSREKTIVAIDNGHVTGRKVGGPLSHIVLEALATGYEPEDQLCYLTKTKDGRVLRSSTIFIREDEEDPASHPIGIISINYDITRLVAMEQTARRMINYPETPAAEPTRITSNVADLLDELIEQSVAMVGKPVEMMNKSDKVRAIGFLSEMGAFLITKSGDKISQRFGISKFTLYNYIDENNKNTANMV